MTVVPERRKEIRFCAQTGQSAGGIHGGVDRWNVRSMVRKGEGEVGEVGYIGKCTLGIGLEVRELGGCLSLFGIRFCVRFVFLVDLLIDEFRGAAGERGIGACLVDVGAVLSDVAHA